MTSTCSISLKLLMDKKRGKVLFAETKKVFVDFLFLAKDVWSYKKFYSCNNLNYACKAVAYDPKAVCPGCGSYMSREVPFVVRNLTTNPLGEQGGFVTGMPKYVVTDDLAVNIMSAISCINLLKMFNVKEIGDLEERVVEITPEEIGGLYATSLDGKEVLTKFFLHDSAQDSS